MIDIRLIRENPDLVRENIRKKFQDAKLPLVDEVIELDKANRAAINEASNLRAERNSLSKKIGMLMGQAKKDPSKLEEAEAVKAQVTAQAARLAELEKQEEELEAKIHKIMLTIPQIIDPSVPLGPDDSCNVEVQRFGEAVVPDFPIPYHTEIMERFDGIDLDAARRVSGNGFYYLMGDIARLHEAVLAYGRDFMISKGFTYCIPPFMIHGNVVEGVMSQTDMDAMMYKIEGEDLYLIGTSEHSMIGKFIDTWLRETPSIRISLDPTLTAFLDDAKYFEEQMTVYTGGYAAGLLELKSENGTLGKMTLSPRGLSDEDRTAGATRAIEYSIAFYDRNRDLLGRNGKLERLKKMQEKGTLRQYVEANLYRPDDK